ncbi:uncharacterized protein LOC129400849 [Sorex araneus]|uniref:uncharacterized protein LOC129400849 n=1 Tax=Sorex araneus TaxID=42254 RepID=UPI002433AD05|nr:uncharacterized protein LOC129400849 [Sorex araneus]XP_054979899.1 uncharacterized protein LOC129400849 [Sorex araneus]
MNNWCRNPGNFILHREEEPLLLEGGFRTAGRLLREACCGPLPSVGKKRMPVSWWWGALFVLLIWICLLFCSCVFTMGTEATWKMVQNCLEDEACSIVVREGRQVLEKVQDSLSETEQSGGLGARMKIPSNKEKGLPGGGKKLEINKEKGLPGGGKKLEINKEKGLPGGGKKLEINKEKGLPGGGKKLEINKEKGLPGGGKKLEIIKDEINGKVLSGLIDTGADVTIIAKKDWPKEWPLTPSLTHLQGTGQSQNPMLSLSPLDWRTEEGKSGTVCPYVLPGLPVKLWGRDILSQMGLLLIDT